ncbi:hypothetical protein PROFUN_11948 [Planoprotostelium fungivorum]|uniref:Uncharacterized protein n=1 Tax=Planoprotostelium fungivorum TaxID=1890364 RepID=A0A2P6N8Y8_9EUKA|nr:hypothetical protein PROFUN_11948 [Planoprotostelium fungivorum]
MSCPYDQLIDKIEQLDSTGKRLTISQKKEQKYAQQLKEILQRIAESDVQYHEACIVLGVTLPSPHQVLWFVQEDITCTDKQLRSMMMQLVSVDALNERMPPLKLSLLLKCKRQDAERFEKNGLIPREFNPTKGKKGRKTIEIRMGDNVMVEEREVQVGSEYHLEEDSVWCQMGDSIQGYKPS